MDEPHTDPRARGVLTPEDAALVGVEVRRRAREIADRAGLLALGERDPRVAAQFREVQSLALRLCGTGNLATTLPRWPWWRRVVLAVLLA